MENEIKCLKTLVLNQIADAYFGLGRISQNMDTRFEEEIIQNAMAALSDENTNSREEYLKLLTHYYTLMGIVMDFKCRDNLSESELEEFTEEAAESYFNS